MVYIFRHFVYILTVGNLDFDIGRKQQKSFDSERRMTGPLKQVNVEQVFKPKVCFGKKCRKNLEQNYIILGK
jgi:hypothetical protein